MKVEHINPFVEAAVKVLSTMARTEVRTGKPFLKEGTETIGEVTGIMGLAGKNLKGYFAITFTENCALKIVSNMIYEEQTKLDETVVDAIGEITNMVCGGAKKDLAEKGHFFAMAIPSVIVGHNIKISRQPNGPVIVLPCQTEHGDFHIEVSFQETG